MTHAVLDKVLSELPSVRKDGQAYLLSEELDITLYASLGDEVLQIQRASRVELSLEMTSVLTHKGERFFLPPERIVALKAGSSTRSVSGSAGFRA